MIADSNEILRAFLADVELCPELDTVVEGRIYCPRLPEGTSLPALAFFTRGGSSSPYITEMPEPSIQFDCWGNSPQEAREVYRALYSSLQGIENQKVTITISDIDYIYYIKSAIEEVHGQDIQDMDFPNYHRVITFFRVLIQV